MATKFEVPKFNGNNFLLWKMKIKAILRKDNCLAAIDRPVEIMDDNKYEEIEDNTIVNLYLALVDGIFSSVFLKENNKGDLGYFVQIVRDQITT